MTTTHAEDSAMTIVLSTYPLSTAYRLRLEETLGGPLACWTLGDLRRQNLTSLMRTLRGFWGKRCVLALEDAGSETALPLLELVSLVARPSAVEVRHPDLSASRITSLGAIRAGLRVARATARAGVAVLAVGREAQLLLRAPRFTVPSIADGPTLYVNANLWFGLSAGGSVGHVAGVVNGLLDEGRDVVLATAPAPVLIRSEALVSRLAPPDAFGVPFELNHFAFHRDIVPTLLTLARRTRPALLYQRLSLGNYAGVILSRELHVPLIVEYNGSEAWAAEHWGRRLRNHKLAVAIEDVNLRHAHLVVTVSDVLRGEVAARGVERERIFTHPNGVDPAVFDARRFDALECAELRRRLGIDPLAVLVTFVGTFGAWHGVEVFAHAIASLASRDSSTRVRHPTRFLFVGDGPGRPTVERIVKDAGAASAVVMTGLVPQASAPAYLAASDILVAPHVPNADGSRFFGSPTKLFEYMAMGKAIVASDLEQIGTVLANSLRVGALPDRDPVAGEGRVGLLCRPGDAEELAIGISFLIERPAWRTSLGDNARREVLARFTWGHHVRALLAALATMAR